MQFCLKRLNQLVGIGRHLLIDGFRALGSRFSQHLRHRDGDMVLPFLRLIGTERDSPEPVSYTHLDVYKRQALNASTRWCGSLAMKPTVSDSSTS